MPEPFPDQSVRKGNGLEACGLSLTICRAGATYYLI